MPAKASRATACSDPAGRLSDFSRRSGCVPAEPYPPLKQPMSLQIKTILAMGPPHYSTFDRTATSTFDRTTTANFAGAGSKTAWDNDA